MNVSVSQNEVIKLWPEGAPGSERWTQVEEEVYPEPNYKVVRNVAQPSLTVYPADPAKANGTAVIVCPGGGWHFLSIDFEGHDVARWLAARGVTAFVLRYRLVRTEGNPVTEFNEHISDPAKMDALMQALVPLMQADGQQAVRLVRERAAEWGVLPGRIGMMGFSAGGHFTTLATLYSTPDCRPDFSAVIYGAVFEDVVAPQDAPPLFLLCANDDDMAVTSSQRLFSAWKAVSRPVEMHIYSKGGHGFAMKNLGLPCDTWIERFADWLALLTS
jgi:acetyl esterase/lipase